MLSHRIDLGVSVSDATVFENALPDGWYDDPAKPNMQRWWSGSEWTDHVRYSDRVRPRAVAIDAPREDPAPTAPLPVFGSKWPEPGAAERPALTIVPEPAYVSEPVLVTHPAEKATASLAAAPDLVNPAFDDFYVPMRQLQSGARSNALLMKQGRSASGAVLWVVVVAALGVTIGVTLWAVVPH